MKQVCFKMFSLMMNLLFDEMCCIFVTLLVCMLDSPYQGPDKVNSDRFYILVNVTPGYMECIECVPL